MKFSSRAISFIINNLLIIKEISPLVIYKYDFKNGYYNIKLQLKTTTDGNTYVKSNNMCIYNFVNKLDSIRIHYEVDYNLFGEPQIIILYIKDEMLVRII